MVDQAKPVAPSPSLTVTFSRPYVGPDDQPTGKRPSKTVSVASAAIAGLIPALPHLVVSDFRVAIWRADQTLTVFMPSSGGTFSRRLHVGPAAINAGEVEYDFNGRERPASPKPDPMGVSDLKRLSTAILSAWSGAGPVDARFDRPITLSL
jgi:hypothetical protein